MSILISAGSFPLKFIHSSLSRVARSNFLGRITRRSSGTNRFWTKEIRFPNPCISIESNFHKDDIIDVNNETPFKYKLHECLSALDLDISGVVSGSLVINAFSVSYPIYEGRLQLHLPTSILRDNQDSDDDDSNDPECCKNESIKAIVCAYSPRATQISIASSNLEREIDVERQVALNHCLLKYGTSQEEVMSMEGSPPARIYRSFVAPRLRPSRAVNGSSERTKSVVSHLHSVEKLAASVAGQIDLALRQIRADQASATYLRNTDHAKTNCNNSLYPIVLLLDNVRSAFNVGSLFRCAATGGVSEIVTVGITAHPPNAKLEKTALTAVDLVSSRHFDDVLEAVEALKQEGYSIVVMETTNKSLDYCSVKYPEKVALVLGNELLGVDTRIMDKADMIIEIPTIGVKNSLNVACAASVVLYEVIRQKRLVN